MVDVELRERERENYLLALYELADGRTVNWPTHRDIGEAAGISDDEVMLVGKDLVDQYLCKFETMGGLDGYVSITQSGISTAERLLTTGRTSRISDEDLRKKVEVILFVLSTEVEKDTSLNADDRLNVTSDLASIREQLQAPTPNRSVVKAALERIKKIWPAVVNITSVAANVISILHGL